MDKCIYSKCTKKECVIIALYADDMLIFGSSLSVVYSTKRFIASQFDMKDMGEAKVILCVKITRMGDSIMISQEHYVEKILKRFENFNAKPVSTPYDANTHLMKNQGDPMGQAEYAQIIVNSVSRLCLHLRDTALEFNLPFDMCRWLVEGEDVEVVHKVLAKHHQYLTSRLLLRLQGLRLLLLHRLVQQVAREVRVTSRGLGHIILRRSQGRRSDGGRPLVHAG